MMPVDKATASTAGDGVFYTGHIVYTTVSFISIMILSILLSMWIHSSSQLFSNRSVALRLQQFYNSPVKALRLLRCITISIYVTSIGMIFTLAMMYNGIGLTTTYATCRSAIIVCFVWYGFNRAGLLFFFIERAHNIRSSELERRKDWIWIIGFLYATVVCLTIYILAMYFSDSTFVNGSTGTSCHIGIPVPWFYALAAMGLTNELICLGIYFWLWRPLLKKRIIVQAPPPDMTTDEDGNTPQFITLKSATNLGTQDSTPLPFMITSEKPPIVRLEALIKKSLYGLLLIMPVETFNFVFFICMKGMEMGWVCFTICTLDGKLTAICSLDRPLI